MKEKAEECFSSKESVISAVAKIMGINSPSRHQSMIIEIMISLISHDKGVNLDNRLTQIEQNCLYWAARGKTSKEIARLLNTNERIVGYHRGKILLKLNCKSVTQAVFEGIHFCYIPPESNVQD